MSYDMRFPRRRPVHVQRALESARVEFEDRLEASRRYCFVQDDLVIANAVGATVRADINSNLQALGNLMDGATAPGTTYKNMFWADRTTNTLKRRNAANSGWIKVSTLDESFVLSRSTNTILGESDMGKTIVVTSTFSQTFTAAATLADGWWVEYRNDGTGVITLDPNAAETIDGATTLLLYPGESCTINCNGTLFKTVGRSRNVQTHGADVASAGTLNLDTATGDQVDVTGTTPVTAITLADGKECTVRFTGILTLTNGASLVLPGGNNIVTAAGDFAVFRGYAAGVVRCVIYTFALAGSSGLVKLASGTVSAQPTLDIVMTAFTAYRNKRLIFNLIPATDGVSLTARVSTDGGATYDSGAAAYSMRTDDEDNVAVQTAFTADSTLLQIAANNTTGNGAAEGCNGVIEMMDTINTARWPQFFWQMSYIGSNATPQPGICRGMGTRRAAQDTDAFRLLFSTGNLASGSWTLDGYN